MTRLAKQLDYRRLFAFSEQITGVSLNCDREGRWHVVLSLKTTGLPIVHCPGAKSPDDALDEAFEHLRRQQAEAQ